jgi:hypothetical protein
MRMHMCVCVHVCISSIQRCAQALNRSCARIFLCYTKKHIQKERLCMYAYTYVFTYEYYMYVCMHSTFFSAFAASSAALKLSMAATLRLRASLRTIPSLSEPPPAF